MSEDTTIPFLDLIWPASTASVRGVADRLLRHLRGLHAERSDTDWPDVSEASPEERARIERRAAR